MLLEICSAVFTVFFFAYMYITWNNDYWLKRRIPYVEPQFLFGNIKQVFLMKKTIGEAYQKIYTNMKGKALGGFFILRQPIMMVMDAKLIRDVLVDKFDSFHDNHITISREAEEILRMNPFLANGNVWKPLRQVLQDSLQGYKVKGMVPLIIPACKHMVKYISNHIDSVLDVQELSGRFATEVVMSCSFGKETNSFTADCQFRPITKRLFNSGFKSNLALLFAFYAPYLSNFFKYRIIGKRLSKFFTNVVTEVCKNRIKKNIKRNDFLQELININKESESFGEGEVYKFNQITAHCVTFLVNGFYPTAVSIGFCLYELAQNQEVQTKVRQELATVHNNMTQFGYEDLQKLKYLDMVIAETLRLHPPIQTMTRQCTQDTTLTHQDMEYNVTRGIPVTVPIYALHRDPDRFSQPDLFKPERFVDPTMDKTNYLPFGAGPRICPAKELSKIIMKMAIGSIVSQFVISPREGLPSLQVDPRKSFHRTAKGGIWLEFKHTHSSTIFYT